MSEENVQNTYSISQKKGYTKDPNLSLKHHLTHENLEPRECIDLGLLDVHDITSGTSGDLGELHRQLAVLIIVEGGDSGEL